METTVNATPIGFLCEHPGCTHGKGRDYYRLAEERVDGWEDEPIYLCADHKNGHEPFVANDFNIPTAAGILNHIIGIYEGRYTQLKPLEEYIKDYAEYHRQAALIAAAESVAHKHKAYDNDFKINKQTILTSYPKERIK